MKSLLKKDIPLLIIVSIPFLYMASIWNELPEEVPVHWNIHGEIDRYGSKIELLLIPILLPLLSYLLFRLIPIIDPKKKIALMGKKYHNLRVILITALSLLATYILYASKSESLSHPNGLTIGLGALFMVLGNYFKTIRPNYFIGIRTPWTLEKESVWKATHQMAGKFWFVGGLAIILSSLLLSNQLNFTVFISITVIISLIPVVYSYLEYRKSS